MKKIFVTGGHYTPAKAVIDQLLNNSRWEIYYIGRKYALEGDKAVSYEYLDLKNSSHLKFLEITTGRLQPYFYVNISQSLISLAKIPIGLWQSLKFVTRYRPDIILSFGGYVAIPIVLIGWLCRVPIVTHEQARVAGIADRIIEPLAKIICVSFPSLVKNKKYVFTGNPIRKETFLNNPDDSLVSFGKIKEKTGLTIVYLTGGKQGSHSLNAWMAKNMEALSRKMLLIVQSGDNQEYDDYHNLITQRERLEPTLRERVLIEKFFSTELIGAVFSLSDLVVGRSGANLTFDLAAMGKPAILIPLPWSRGGEQEKNAQELVCRGLVEIVSQDKINEQLLKKIESVLANLPRYADNAGKARELYVKDSAEQIVRILNQFVK